MIRLSVDFIFSKSRSVVADKTILRSFSPVVVNTLNRIRNCHLLNVDFGLSAFKIQNEIGNTDIVWTNTCLESHTGFVRFVSGIDVKKVLEFFEKAIHPILVLQVLNSKRQSSISFASCQSIKTIRACFFATTSVMQTHTSTSFFHVSKSLLSGQDGGALNDVLMM